MALHKEVVKKSLPSLPPRGFLQPRRGDRGKRKVYSPLPWSDFFDRYENIKAGNNCFRVYLKGSAGPALLLLHGGGHSALSWAVFAVAMSKLVECQVAALDIRGHGNTVTENDANLSAETLVNDVQAVAEALYGEESPPVVLMGHSMGGAIAVRVAAKLAIPSLVGLAVIDVVEGTAMDSLSGMHSFLTGRPQSFKSLEHAIEWSVRSGQLRNVQSARVSVLGQVMRSDEKCADTHSTEGVSNRLSAGSLSGESIPEEEEGGKGGRRAECEVGEGGGESGGESGGEQGEGGGGESGGEERVRGEGEDDSRGGEKRGETGAYKWRIDLMKTEPFWKGWFSGLSKLFLSCPVPKMLILAGVDRLDKELTIGQMQGKFQMQVLSGCGHAVHEDVPDKVAEIIAGYLVRHRFAEAKEGYKRPFPAC